MKIYIVKAEAGDGYGHSISLEYVGAFLSEREANDFADKRNESRGEYGPWNTVHEVPILVACPKCNEVHTAEADEDERMR